MNQPPVIESLSAESLVSQAADEFLDGLARGEQPDVEEFARRYPQIAQILRHVLPALQVLRPPSEAGAAADVLAAEGPLTGCLGDYRLLREVGRGGMGVVYEAEQISLGRRVALKVLPFAATLDPRHLQRFKNEAQAAAQLHHQHIVPVYAVGVERGVHYYAMQFIDGHTVATLIDERRGMSRLPRHDEPGDPDATGPYVPTPPAAVLSTERSAGDPAYFHTVARLGVQAAEALEHAHQLGVIHRDIKPANLLIDGRGSLWVTDFGLAQFQTDTKLTLTGDLVGTLRYMSPEQALARQTPVDHRTDIYSLGATLYELLTLEPVFDGRDRQELLRQIAQEEPTAPRRRDKAIPAELETIVLKALAKTPEERFATAQELAEDLQRFLRDEPIKARRPTVLQRVRKWTRRHRTVVLTTSIATLASLLLGMAGLGLALYRVQQEKERAEHNFREAEANKERAEHNFREAEANKERAEHNFREAEENLEVAFAAVEKMLEEVGFEWLADVPQMEQPRRRLLEQALAFYRRLLDLKSNAPNVRLRVARAHHHLGIVHHMLGQRDRAEQDCDQAQTILRRLDREFPGTPVYRDFLAMSLNSLGLVYNAEGQPGKSAAAYREARTIREELVRQYPSVAEYHHLLGGVLSNLADLQRGRDEEAARTLVEEAVRRQQAALDLKPQHPAYRKFLRTHFCLLAEILLNQGQPADAERAIRQGLDVNEKLVRDLPHAPELQADLAQSHMTLGKLLDQTGRAGEAEAAYRQAVSIYDALLQRFPTVLRFGRGLVDSQASPGDVLTKAGRFVEAEEVYRQTAARADKLAATWPNEPHFRFRQANSLNDLANVLQSLGRPAEVEPTQRRALAIVEKLAADAPSEALHQSLLGAVLNNLANQLRRQKNVAEAASLLDRAIHHQQIALTLSPQNTDCRKYLLNHHLNRIELYVQAGEHAPAAKMALVLPRLVPDGWLNSHRAAFFLARCVPLAEIDDRIPHAQRQLLAKSYADQAMTWLRQSVAKGFPKPDQIRKDQVFAPLRDRDDFRELIAELEAKKKP